MDEIQDPGAPRTDELARNAARNAITDMLYAAPVNGASHAAAALNAAAVTWDHTVTWERDVNSAGVAVRRYVLRGAWEVDPGGEEMIRRYGSPEADAQVFIANAKRAERSAER